MADDYGDFKEVVDESKTTQTKPQDSQEPQDPTFVRAKTPRQGELIGVVLQRLGGNKMEVKATDGKIRNCRVPGRFKRSMWLRPKDYVLIDPWKNDDSKADVIFQYRGSAINQLRKKGLLKGLEEKF